MKEQFTQGDWEIDRSYSTMFSVGSKGGESVCEVDCSCTFNELGDYQNAPTEEETANAHLIAAAPKMYKMLQEWVMHVDNGDTDHAIINEHVAIITRELLAEARGETT